MYIWIHDKYSSTSFKQRLSGLWQTEKWFWYNKTNFSSHVSHCGSVVKELPARADKLGSTPGDAVFCFFVPFFFCLVFVFNTIFPFGLFSFILTADPADHEHWYIYILCLSPKFYFGKGISRSKPSPWSAYWPSLQPEKTISCQDMSLLWNSWTFLNVSWHHDKQHTVHHKLYF